MKIQNLFEVTADDIFRKLDGLNAMIKDPATTPNEKHNAAKLKQNIAN